MDVLRKIENFVDGLENTAVDLVSRLSPWLAPLPTAYLTATATIEHLDWPLLVGVVTGVIVESLGLGTIATALELREYNATRRVIPGDWEPFDKNGRRKTYKKPVDPEAPFALATGLSGIYFASVTALTVVLDTAPNLATFAPLVFPILSLSGATVLAIRADHVRRLRGIATTDEERATKAREKKQPQQEPKTEEKEGATIDNMVALVETYGAAGKTLALLMGNPELSRSELAQLGGVTPQSISKHLATLEQKGAVSRANGATKVLVMKDGGKE